LRNIVFPFTSAVAETREKYAQDAHDPHDFLRDNDDFPVAGIPDRRRFLENASDEIR